MIKVFDFDAVLDAVQTALQQAPRVPYAVRVDAAPDVLSRVIHNPMFVLAT